MGAFVTPPGQPGPLQPGEFSSISRPNVVTFGFEGIGPPSSLYIQRDDQLAIEAYTALPTNDTVTIIARLLLPVAPTPGQPASGADLMAPAPPTQGSTIVQIQAQLIPVQNSGAVKAIVPLAEGYLLSVAASSLSATSRGDTFVRAWITRPPIVSGNPSGAEVLFGDYVAQFAPVGWPFGRAVHPTEGPGELTSMSVGNPAAGSDWSLVVPNNNRWRIQSWNAQLVTAAAVANRIVRAQIKNTAGVVVWQAAPSAVIPASQTVQVCASDVSALSVADPGTISLPLPAPTMLLTNMSLGVSTTALQAGDQWSSIRVMTETWIDLV